MSEKVEGPGFHLSASCFRCDYWTSESYRVQGDSGQDVFCNHPSVEKKQVGDSRWDTPDWCPVVDLPSIRAAVSAITRAKEGDNEG